jgi:hypothetical protein
MELLTPGSRSGKGSHSPPFAGELAGNFTLHFLRVYMAASYAEIVNWAKGVSSALCLAVTPLSAPGTRNAVGAFKPLAQPATAHN